MQAQLTLRREGQFQVEATEDRDTQCGIMGTSRFDYRVEVTCRETALDENGFIVDQLEIHKAMQEKYRMMFRLPSCEELAIHAAKMIASMCREIERVSVTISPMQGASMTATVNF